MYRYKYFKFLINTPTCGRLSAKRSNSVEYPHSNSYPHVAIHFWTGITKYQNKKWRYTYTLQKTNLGNIGCCLCFLWFGTIFTRSCTKSLMWLVVLIRNFITGLQIHTCLHKSGQSWGNGSGCLPRGDWISRMASYRRISQGIEGVRSVVRVFQ